MRVVALLTVRNEERYLARCLEHLYDQGIETCLIDNGSTDRTLEIAESFLGRGVFRIEHFPFNGTYEWEKILLYKEKLATEIDADWFIHHDADEIREAPSPYKTLKEGIEEADRQGYNAINFDEFVFLPTSEDESFEGKDYVREMQYYYFFEPYPLRRVNAWKKTANIDLHSSGGHRIEFAVRKIFPTQFILRHYIVLSKSYAIEKYGNRVFSEAELAKGWHGDRKYFSSEKIVFPPRKRLKKIDNFSQYDWDKSDPWVKHQIFSYAEEEKTVTVQTEISPAKLPEIKADLERSRFRLAEIRENLAAKVDEQNIGNEQPVLDLNRLNLLMDEGRINEAEADCQQLVAKYPDRPEGKIGLARVAVRSQQHSLALERWQAVIEQFPEQIEAYVGKGKALIELGRIDEAKTLFQQLADNYPNNPQGLIELATVYQIYKDWETALTYWEKCAVKWPDIFWVQAGKANALMQLRKFAEAETIFKQLETQYLEKPQGIEGLTRLARLSGNLELSLQYADKLIARFPHLQTGYWEKEQAFIELGRFAEANQAFLSRPSFPNQNIIKRKTPVGFPPDLVLPEMVGVNNDYTFLEKKLKDFVASGQEYTLPVSIILPVYNRKQILAKTLAAINHQTYPKSLIEVVVVDDGSSDGVEEVVRKYENYFDLIYTRQADKGYRAAAARNLGMRTAKYNYFITLDCDILPYPELVESYMKWFHVTDQAILIGHRRYVCSDAITDDEILQNIDVALNLPDIIPNNQVAAKPTSAGLAYDWRFPIYARTNYKKKQRWYFQGVVSANMAYPRKAIEVAGGYDESFQDWGGEDNEMGYRFYNAGYYLIPVMEAMGLHQEPPGGKNETDREAGFKITKKILEQKCPAPIHRNYCQGEIYEIPKVSIYIPAYNAAKYIQDAVDSALNQTYTDLEVCICDDGSTDETLKILETNYADNPRVRWVSQPNGGIGKASNTAVRMCRGMYIGQLDADDFLKPYAVELAVNYLDNNDVGCVYSYHEVVDADGHFVREREKQYLEFSREALLIGMMVSHFRMFRKRDWMRTAGFDEELVNAVDYDMCLKLSEVCYFQHLDSYNYCYRWHGTNTSIKQRKQQEVNHLTAINKALARLGLGDIWEAVQGDIVNPRSTKLQRRNEPKSKASDEIKVREIKQNQREAILVRVKLAYELLHQGNIPGAIEEFNQTLTLPGDKTAIYQGLGDAYRIQELEQARAYAKHKK